MIATVEVLRYAAGGNCVAKHDGRVLFIRGVIPGEIVTVEIPANSPSKRYAMATLVSIDQPAPNRILPPCKYFGSCGGCDWQHLSIADQVKMHVAVLQDQLFRIGKFEDLKVLPVKQANGETGVGYRTRSRFAVSEQGNLGMRKFHSNEIVEIDECLIACADINSVTRNNWEPGIDVTIVQANDEVLILTDREFVPDIEYRNEYGSWLVPAGDFWQVHKAAPEMLIAEVLAQLTPKLGDRIADLYSGVGLFSQPLAKIVGNLGKVVAVEFDQRAHFAAQKNLSKFSWADPINADVAQYLKTASGFNKVVVDPPRSGLNSSVIKSLTKLPELDQICYVSCDAGTLARDLREFADLGWQIGEIQPILLFPMTSHLEAVVSVSKLS